MNIADWRWLAQMAKLKGLLPGIEPRSLRWYIFDVLTFQLYRLEGWRTVKKIQVVDSGNSLDAITIVSVTFQCILVQMPKRLECI